jgi:heptosyltransferase-2
LTRTLVVAPSWIGDAVLSHPLLVRLREADRAATIDVLAPPWVLAVYRRMPEVSGTIENPFGHGALRLGARRRFARSLAAYDRAIVLPNSFKAALVPWHAGIRERVGYRGEMRFGLLNDARRLDTTAVPLQVERYAALAQPAGETLRRPLPEPRLVIDAAARDAAVARLALDLARPVAVFAPGAEYGPAKRWPAAHFAALGRMLVERGEQVWLFGSAKDSSIAREIAASIGEHAVDLTGRTSLDEAIAVLSLAAHVVSNDSGLMHIAAALARPMAAIFGSSSPAYTPPLSAQARVVRLNLACSPCFQRECPLEHANCLRLIEPSRVMNALEPLQ